MDEERLNRAVRGIRMPEDARQRLLYRLQQDRPCLLYTSRCV
ncbi:hypothetical protein [Allofournierella massiliensis]|nr:hypothetical protein [Fournierella massiliensis]